MPALFYYPHTVTRDEIDILGHANNLAYLQWMQSAAVAHSDEQGWTTADYQKLGSGWVVRSHSIEYLAPAFLDEPIIVRTWVADLKKVTSLRRYEIIRADDATPLAIAATNWAYIKFETHRPTRIPPEVAEAFEIFDPGA